MGVVLDATAVSHCAFRRRDRWKGRLLQNPGSIKTETLKPSEEVREDARVAVRHLLGRQVAFVVVDACQVQGAACRAYEGPEPTIARQAPLTDEVVRLWRDGAVLLGRSRCLLRRWPGERCYVSPIHDCPRQSVRDQRRSGADHGATALQGRTHWRCGSSRGAARSGS